MSAWAALQTSVSFVFYALWFNFNGFSQFLKRIDNQLLFVQLAEWVSLVFFQYSMTFAIQINFVIEQQEKWPISSW